jgi:hypothetical protein
MTLYQKRPVRFLERYQAGDWTVKMYSISVLAERVSAGNVTVAKTMLPEWLEKAGIYPLATYRVATLILHEGKEGCFAIISWWIDENMLQLFVYLAPKENPATFTLYSDRGIVTCVWELAVLWFERNAWVSKMLEQPDNPAALREYLALHSRHMKTNFRTEKSFDQKCFADTPPPGYRNKL